MAKDIPIKQAMVKQAVVDMAMGQFKEGVLKGIDSVVDLLNDPRIELSDELKPGVKFAVELIVEARKIAAETIK